MNLKNVKFRKSLKYEIDYDMVKLLNIQRKIEQYKNDKNEISKLIARLNSDEKEKIIQLYKNQIVLLNNSLCNYKNKIEKIQMRLKS